MCMDTIDYFTNTDSVSEGEISNDISNYKG